MLDWFERTNKPCSRELMDWIILADLTVMKEFLVIQAIEHDQYYYCYYNTIIHTQYFLQQHLLSLNI